MRKLIRQRLLLLPTLLLGVTFVVFLSIHLIPGDPAKVIAGDFATDAQVQAIRVDFGLTDPLPVQYGRYLERLAHGDLGESLFAKRPVAVELGERLPASLELVLVALLVGVPAGALLGVRAAVRKDTAVDNAATVGSLVGLSVPSFWLGLVLAWLFGVQLGWLPFSGRLPAFTDAPHTTGLLTVDALLHGDWWLFGQAVRYLVLPGLTLAVLPTALVARYSRAAFIEVLNQDYIRTARAYGLPARTVVWRYAAKNAMLPLVTLVGGLIPAMLAGAVLVETVFGWPGVGTLLLGAINTRDYPVIQSVTLVFALIYIVANLVVDLSYGLLDPRTRES
jgi:ABC-type dipeptide/oligopeptide/nickel transport system permease component